MVVEIAAAEREIYLGGLIDEVDGFGDLGGHEPGAPTVSDSGCDKLGVGHGELHGDFGAFPFAEHVYAAGVDGVGFARPGDEFLDGLMVGGSEFAGLGGGGKENVLGGEALAEEALADGEEVVAGGGVVLLEAENEAQLRGGVGRRFDDVLDDGFAGGVLEFALGFKSGEGAGEEEEGG